MKENRFSAYSIESWIVRNGSWHISLDLILIDTTCIHMLKFFHSIILLWWWVLGPPFCCTYYLIWFIYYIYIQRLDFWSVLLKNWLQVTLTPVQQESITVAALLVTTSELLHHSARLPLLNAWRWIMDQLILAHWIALSFKFGPGQHLV